eukprot:8351073-Ditylum_brightwellii.AAC.1
MRIAKDFLKEAIQLVATRRPSSTFNIEEGVADMKLGESRTYKLHMQLEEDKSPLYFLTVEVRQLLRGQNMGYMGPVYIL